MPKRTPLFAAHQKLGARLVEFGGWEMPLYYSGIIEEHQTVRAAVGLFDISHMGELLVTGLEAESFLNRVLTNDLRKIGLDQAQYTLMCAENGGVIDDLYVYRVGQDSFLLVVNASRIEADYAWIEQQWNRCEQRDQVQLSNVSDRYGALAVQGPASPDLMDAAFPFGLVLERGGSSPSSLKKNQVAAVGLSVGSSDYGGFIARTGYTGEDGFEIIAPGDALEMIWNKLLNLGSVYGIKPAGLGARDTLRTEVCYPLYGHELDQNTTPLEAGLGFFVALDKPDFPGRPALAEQKAAGVEKKCVAFKMADKSAPPRPHYAICNLDGARIGEVTSGTQSPSLGIGIGLGYVPPESAKPGTALNIEIRGRQARAWVVARPIYKKAV